MASSVLSALSNQALLYRLPSISHLPNPAIFSISFPKASRTRRSLVRPIAVGTGPDLLGDFGARDPFPEELASNFAENVLGDTDTLHRILIPNITALSLSQMKLEPVESLTQPLSADDAGRLLKKIVGWRLVEVDGVMRLQCEWRLRDAACGEELISRINKVLENTGHYPNISLEQPNIVKAELYTPSIGGLSINDFIIGAKIDKVKVLDLLPRKRVWA
ncbi:Transcriptional coactivator/pterin dehydratase [Rhynchospora pubera]|uniref:4a-hydroxytetrahydrobiopterin dehydratase n=1 Tax=Rhynchospora pubera TaxID=906938 RepID=A0AAV8E7G4_9POAL|nr:Transcriptional coactivator/pterin dehydratase [Rhynchospora pubera]KAJ4803145.1 Transcriptional coactivator/pterin dehydratase [Rhynchospora pubera]